MLRSSWKIQLFLREKKNLNTKKRFKIYDANFIININMLGFLFLVYVGNKFKKIIITEIHVGLLLSSLLITRYNDGVLHTKDKKKKKIKKNNG